MNTNQVPPLIRLSEAARIYGLSKTTFIRLRKQKILRVFKTHGGQNMFYRDDINNFLKQRTEENALNNS